MSATEFLSRAGDARVTLPLVEEVVTRSGQASADAMWALTGVAHRLGRNELLRLLNVGADDATRAQAESFVDQIFIYGQDAVERHFETFYARSLSRAAGSGRRPEAPALTPSKAPVSVAVPPGFIHLLRCHSPASQRFEWILGAASAAMVVGKGPASPKTYGFGGESVYTKRSRQ